MRRWPKKGLAKERTAWAWPRSGAPSPTASPPCFSQTRGPMLEQLNYTWVSMDSHFHPSRDHVKEQAHEGERLGTVARGWHVPKQKPLVPMAGKEGPHSLCLSLSLPSRNWGQSPLLQLG